MMLALQLHESKSCLPGLESPLLILAHLATAAPQAANHGASSLWRASCGVLMAAGGWALA